MVFYFKYSFNEDFKEFLFFFKILIFFVKLFSFFLRYLFFDFNVFV